MLMEHIESQHEERLKCHAKNFLSKVKDLRVVSNKCLILFVEEVQKVENDVNLQVKPIKTEMS